MGSRNIARHASASQVPSMSFYLHCLHHNAQKEKHSCTTFSMFSRLSLRKCSQTPIPTICMKSQTMPVVVATGPAQKTSKFEPLCTSQDTYIANGSSARGL